MKFNIVKIEGHTLPVREYQGQKVVTFKDIATVHQVDPELLRRNFNRNRNHFIKETDFFFIENQFDRDILSLSKKTRKLNIFTESGYLMLVKSLTDDLSWKIQRQLVNCYFNVKSKSVIYTHIDKRVLKDMILVYMEHLTGYPAEWFNRMIHYRSLPLSQEDTAKLLDTTKYAIVKYEKMMHKLGMGRIRGTCQSIKRNVRLSRGQLPEA